MDDESHERALAEVARQGADKLDKSREFYEMKIEELSNKLDAAVDEAAVQVRSTSLAILFRRTDEIMNGFVFPNSHTSLILDLSTSRPTIKIKEFEETYRQIEEDCDQEILDLKWKYETILKRERDGNFRLKAESGLIRLDRSRSFLPNRAFSSTLTLTLTITAFPTSRYFYAGKSSRTCRRRSKTGMKTFEN